MNEPPIYLDNHATTRTDARVVQAMLPYFVEHYGNAASRQHAFGRRALEAVDRAREQVAALLGASPGDVIFTSGATESNNLALKGAAHANRAQGDHLITVSTEHHAVLDPCRRLEQEGFRLTVLPVDHYGRITADQVAQAVSPRTILVSVMAANNEIGTLQPLAAIGRICKERGVLFHTDAAQAFGKIPLDVEALGIDLLSLSAHKIYGPKGIGVLMVRRRAPRVRLEPLFDGGGHERGLRSGTLAVPLIVGLGEACNLCAQEMSAEAERLRALRERLWSGLQSALPDCTRNGHPTESLPGNLNVSFPHVHAEALVMEVRHIALSSGSACTSASVEPSYVLRAIGLEDDLAHSSLRFGLGRFTTEEEIDRAVAAIIPAARRLRELNPLADLSTPGSKSARR